MDAGTGNRADVVRALLLVTGAALLLAALLYNATTLAPLASGAFRPLTLEKIRGVRSGFALAGVAFLAASFALRRWPALGSGRLAEWSLFVVVGLLPFVLVDFGLRPFVEPRTTLFVADDELGWRMRPYAEDEWGDVRVRVNERGLRGPALPYAKPPGERRIVFLGDSVTFGFGIEDEDELFASQVGRALGARVVNAGVGGYSPWQERLWLAREGLRYEPDLVVVSFVLNDVTEKLSLVRYGGGGRGWQLARTARGRLDRWASGSALITAARRGTAAVRFGRDVQLGAAQREAEDVKRLALDPELPVVARGWRITLANLDGLLDLAAEHDVPLLVVVFPYAFQLEAPRRLGDPQRRLVAHLEARGRPVLDLLPRFAAHPAPDALMLDPSHPSVEGHALAARAIVERLEAEGWPAAVEAR
ncbi:MAG: SGNH/GDSL hydrolase family protein [Myxococcota bacterium]